MILREFVKELLKEQDDSIIWENDKLYVKYGAEFLIPNAETLDICSDGEEWIIALDAISNARLLTPKEWLDKLRSFLEKETHTQGLTLDKLLDCLYDKNTRYGDIVFLVDIDSAIALCQPIKISPVCVSGARGNYLCLHCIDE